MPVFFVCAGLLGLLLVKGSKGEKLLIAQVTPRSEFRLRVSCDCRCVMTGFAWVVVAHLYREELSWWGFGSRATGSVVVEWLHLPPA